MVPLTRPGIVIGSIFVVTIVIGDYVTIGVMGGQQIASIGKVIQVQLSYLQFPLAAANAMVLLAVVLDDHLGHDASGRHPGGAVRSARAWRLRVCVPAKRRAGLAGGLSPGHAESRASRAL